MFPLGSRVPDGLSLWSFSGNLGLLPETRLLDSMIIAECRLLKKLYDLVYTKNRTVIGTLVTRTNF